MDSVLDFRRTITFIQWHDIKVGKGIFFCLSKGWSPPQGILMGDYRKNEKAEKCVSSVA